MRINTNVSSLNTQRILGKTGSELAQNIGRLSSGFRINRAADDAAGLGVANKLRSDIRALQQAARNAEQGTALLQIAEGATQTIGNIVDRMKELAAQSASAFVVLLGLGLTVAGATTVTSYPASKATWARTASPRESIPSSLVTSASGTCQPPSSFPLCQRPGRVEGAPELERPDALKVLRLQEHARPATLVEHRRRHLAGLALGSRRRPAGTPGTDRSYHRDR